MKRDFQRLAAFLTVIVAVAGCVSPLATTETESSSDLATVVSMTLQALSPQTTETPAASPKTLLPHTFYYLSNDAGGLLQVFRIHTDGKTVKQLSNGEGGVTDYDVSPADGRIAFVANNQLSLILPDGSNQRLLVDGGPIENNAHLTHPVFSPDGKTLAYGYKGLNLYDLASGTSRMAIQDQLGDPMPDGTQLPIEVYWPERYSPDGTKLLVAMGHWEVAPSHAIYYPERNELVRPHGTDIYGYCCSFYGRPSWSADSSSVYGVASEHDYSFPHGSLWKVDAATGAVTTLISLVEKDGTLNLPSNPFLGPDGQLYFFFLNYPEPAGDFGRLPLQLVRSAADGTGRTVLRLDTFSPVEVLWAPDASFVIVTSEAGQAEIVYLDGRPNVPLASSAQQIRWGP